MTIFLPPQIDVNKLIYLLQERYIYVDNASRMYLERNKQKAIRLSISQVDEKKIELGIQQIAACILEVYEKNNYNAVSFKPYF